MTVDWWTLALQAVNFLILVWLMRRFLYRPVRDILDRRKALAEEAFAEADRKKAEADAVKERLEADRDHFAEERQDVLRNIHQELEEERRKLLDAARQEAGKLIDDANDRIAQEKEEALRKIRKDAASLAGDLAATLLEKTAAGAPSDAVLDQIENHFKTLPAEERERLEKDLATEGARVSIVTAAPLPPDSQTRWRERLGQCFGQADRLDFATDPSILGGVELHFPHAVLRFTWADLIRQTTQRIASDDNAA